MNPVTVWTRLKTIRIENIPPIADALLQHTMQGEQPIKLVSGLQVKMHSKEVLHQIPEVGLGMNATRSWTWDECNKKWMPVWMTHVQPIAKELE